MRHRMSMTVLAVALGLPASTAAADDKKDEKKPVSGLFKGNGQDGKLAFASAQKGDPINDKPTVVLIFTEKDHSKEKNPRIKAFFGDFGSALIITCTHDGKVVGCEVAHSNHKKSGFNDLGVMKSKDFKIADGKVAGKLTTDGEVDTFGEKWEVKIEFAVKSP